ncbi:MAG: hypothetical protein R2788_13880 [Saprospiraceae bacterium]
MMNTTKNKETTPVNGLPQSCIEGFSQLNLWHHELRQLCEKRLLEGKEETHFLNEIILQKKAEYFQQIEYLGELTFNFSKKEKKHFFDYIAATGLHEELKGAPFYFHGIYKPRGYAGDAESMALVYRNDFEGADTFAKLMNKIATESAACIAIRNRKNLLRKTFDISKNKKILSLAAGPAQEIYEHLNHQENNHSFLALDHDIKTLQEAKKRNTAIEYGLANAFQLIKGNQKYLLPRNNNLENYDPKSDGKGLKKILIPFKYKIKKLKPNSFDLIYSAGLFDYIKTFSDPEKGTLALTKKLFDLLKPNGRLLIGNASPKMPPGIIWAMECLCDWHLIYRTKKEVLDFADAIPKNQIKTIDVIAEETGINWFLDLQKK